MNTEKVNHVVSTVASIGVLLGLLLLAYELNQNREMMRAQIRNEISQGVFDLLSLQAVNLQLADLLDRGNAGEALTSAETQMYTAYNELVFRYWENAHYQYRQGMYDEEEFSKHLDTMGSVLNESDTFMRDWCKNRLRYSAPFAAEMDSMIAGGTC